MHQKRWVKVLLVMAALAVVVLTCGKKAPPVPPIPILPPPAQGIELTQVGDQMIFAFQLPALSSDNKTPLQIGKIEIFRLKDPRVSITGAAQTQTSQTQTSQTQTKRTQTQTFPQTIPAPQSQTQTQTQPQTQTQSAPSAPPAPPEMPRALQEQELDDRAEKIAEIPADQIAAYLRDNSFFFKDKINTQIGSEDYKNWFYYSVRIYNKKGKQGAYSKSTATFPAAVPKPPSNFTAMISEKNIHLTWIAPKADITGKPLQSSLEYNIYRGNTANFAPTQPINSTPLTTNSYDDTSFEYGKPYYYFIRATQATLRHEQESAPSNVILIYPQDIYPPSAPQELNVVAAKEGMVLIWSPNPESDVAGYNIYRSLKSGTDYKKINKELVRETTFTDPDIQKNVTYYYVVAAMDSAPVPNESKYSNEVFEVQKRP